MTMSLKKKTLEIQDWPRESVEDLGGLEARGCAHFTKKKDVDWWFGT